MKITILSLFPDYFSAFIQTSVIARAYAQELFEFEVIDFRSFTKEKHGHVDDAPYGGGAGMVLQCQPIIDALRQVKTDQSTVILLTPQGKIFKQSTAVQLSQKKHLIFICGHYEGFDERIRNYVDIQLSLGDFVLTGGEPACAVMCDAIIRLLPGVIKADSVGDDSFSEGLLEYPQYTRPENFEGLKVPRILLSGDHAKIASWRHEQSLINTAKHRPDLLKNIDLDVKDQEIVHSILKTKNK